MIKKFDDKVYEIEDKCGSWFLMWMYKGNLIIIFVNF